jgi:polyisoprenoid-binding protein YceI
MTRLASAFRLLCAALLFALVAPPSQAQDENVQDANDAVLAVVDSTRSHIDYTGSAPAHDWTGTSRDLAGTVRVDADAPADASVEITVPVASFDSGNSTRDSKMRSTLSVDRYPTVTFRSDSVEVVSWGRTDDGYAGRWRVRGPLTFHGRTHPIETLVRVWVGADTLTARVTFPVSLTRFEVDRPRLLFVPIGDTIEIDAVIRAGLRPSTSTARARP